MSMIGNFLLVSDEDISELLAAPETIQSFLERRVYEVDEPADHVDVDKAWHALHFLLTGSAWEGTAPLDFIAVGGEAIGDEDVGYGPARALRSRDVVALDRALEKVPTSELVRRYDAAKMEELEIYPGGWSTLNPAAGDEFGYFSGAYDDVRALVRRAAQDGRGLLIWLN